MKEVIFAGFGGQGVLTAGLILAHSAMEMDRNVSWMPAYGPEMRGGTANSTVKFGEAEGERIGTPIMHRADAAVIMNEASLKFLRYCKPGALILMNSDTISEQAGRELVGDHCVVKLPSDQLAFRAQNAKGTSIVMLGALIRLGGFFSREHVLASMESMFAKKGKSKYSAANAAAFIAGYEAAKGGEDR